MSPREILPDITAQKTVYVIGAGASVEVGLPTGEILKNTISNKLNFQFGDWKVISGSQRIWDAIQAEVDKLPNNEKRAALDSYQFAGHAISRALPGAHSIDNLIHIRGDNQYIALCGKLAIAESILEAERASYLYSATMQQKLNLKSLEGTWYVSFLKILLSDCRIEALGSRLEKLALIIFNYDRCVEHFLQHALQIVYEIPPNEAAKLVNLIEIYHPYGAVGKLPDHGSGITEGQFGLECRPLALLKVANELKTFTEGVDSESSDIVRIRALMHNSPKLVFLGFAYYKQNMNLLFGSHPYASEIPSDRAQNVFGTVFKVSEKNASIISTDLISRTNLRNVPVVKAYVDLKAQKGFDFLNDHDRSLAF